MAHKDIKVKKIVIERGKSTRYIQHNGCVKVWFIEQGVGELHYALYPRTPQVYCTALLRVNDIHVIHDGQWYGISNASDIDMVISEVQFIPPDIEDRVRELYSMDYEPEVLPNF